jgi:hypothetical protein
MHQQELLLVALGVMELVLQLQVLQLVELGVEQEVLSTEMLLPELAAEVMVVEELMLLTLLQLLEL